MTDFDPENTPTLSNEGPTQAPSRRDQPELTQIGPYKLLERIGEGGMGEVWLAEQTAPVRRLVALKLIKAGMDSREVIARFESERQALALMSHPAIARVYDAGMTPLGRPYFAMEHVPGESMTEYCDRQRVALRDRLELFMQVCEGVQHAHQKGVIHRDLKPGNVLVSLVEGKPACKIIDFGVAKATQQRLTDNTYYTHIGTLVGTPEYMSPEQAELTSVDVDTRTDVYSLGVILYELLVGSLPFEVTQARSISHEEVRRRIREDEPPLPSARISALGEKGSLAAQQRGTEPGALRRQVKGDLDWITHKALEKDRTRRYGSPMELAADIRRHLDDEPVVAGPPSATYRLSKFVRRHRIGVVAVSAIAAALVAGLGLAIWGLVRAQRAEAAAHREAAASEQVSDFLVGLFKNVDPTKSRGGSVTAREVLDRGAANVDKDLSGQPELHAHILHVIGTTYDGLGLHTEAEGFLQRAYDTSRTALGPMDMETLDTMRDIGMLRARTGRAAEGEALLREALESVRKVQGPDSLEALQTQGQLGEILQAGGKLAEAEPILRESLEKRTRIQGANNIDVLVAKSNLAGLLLEQGKPREAEPLFTEALEGMRRTVGPDDSRAISALNDLGTLQFFEGKVADAEPLFREVLERYTRILGPDHSDSLTAANNLGVLLASLGRLQETETIYRDVLERRRRLLGDDNPETLYSVHNMGGLMHDLGRLEESEKYLREALERRMKVLGQEHPETLQTESDLCMVMYDMGRLPEAERLCRSALEGRLKVLGAEHAETHEASVILASVVIAQGRPGEVEASLRETLELFLKDLPANDPRVLAAKANLGQSLARQGKLAEAEPLLVAAAMQMGKRRGGVRRDEKETLEQLVQVCQKLGKPADAARWRAQLKRSAA